ncbi:MAG: hypothetical protein E5X34_02895 [Mesorhizobium sp.]|uniref:hypothetical protein n=1 Tax=Mesorhizobium sp. TaxID=1871066 RepID=UPI001222A8AF|nr:hypothetical protein [Mesorhizobium sp.]TIR26600.1 MAG: hypothetical protein E5X34_02895 [Mesorhizobium sp.]
MTLVAITKSKAYGKIVACADTRISGGSKLTEAGSKLFPLSISIYNSKMSIIYRRAFGFAFAGSTLVAHSVFSFSSSALQGLRINKGGKVPSLEEIAKFVAVYAKEFIQEIGEVAPGQVNTEITIFGFCPVTERARLFKAAPEFQADHFDMQFGELDFQTDGICHLLGSKEAAADFVALAKGGREPAEAIQEIIRSEKFAGVGGSVQVLTVDGSGARHLPVLYRTEGGGAVLKLLGKRIEDYGNLGGCDFRNEAWGVLDE